MSELNDQIRADAKKLFGELVAFARSMLNQHGEFLPFAYAINADGRLEAFGAYTGEEKPSARELYELLEGGLAAAAKDGRIRAAGICASVTINAEGQRIPALRIVTEHVGGPAASTLMPFRLDGAGNVTFGKAKSRPVEHKLCPTT